MLRVTIYNPDTGDTRTEVVADDDYLLVPGDKITVAHQVWSTGTHQITLRGCRPAGPES